MILSILPFSWSLVLSLRGISKKLAVNALSIPVFAKPSVVVEHLEMEPSSKKSHICFTHFITHAHRRYSVSVEPVPTNKLGSYAGTRRPFGMSFTHNINRKRYADVNASFYF